MVKCMASVYCWLWIAASTASEKSGNNQSPTVSKSCGDHTPQIDNQKNFTSKTMIEITSLPTDKKQFTRASYAITSYRWVSILNDARKDAADNMFLMTVLIYATLSKPYCGETSFSVMYFFFIGEFGT